MRRVELLRILSSCKIYALVVVAVVVVDVVLLAPVGSKNANQRGQLEPAMGSTRGAICWRTH